MATEVKRRTSYASYGNVAYDPAYLPEREVGAEERPLIRQRERVRSRARVMVRPAGYVSPTAVIGFLAVAAMAVMLLMSYVRLTAAGSEVVQLRKESAALAEEHSKLLSEYELAFDLKTVEEVATTQMGMTKPQPGQEIVTDLSEPDSAQVYQKEAGFFAKIWNSVADAANNIVAFFR